METLSIVIPAKNESANLPRLLTALRKQTVQPQEVIVADAQSTDDTGKLASKLGAKVVEGGMPGVGRNRGAAVAKGELILFLDADVTIKDHDFIRKAVKEFEERELDIASVNLYVTDGKIYDKVCHDFCNLYVRMWGEIWPHGHGCCMLVKRALHERIGGFDEKAMLSEDREYSMRAAKQGKFGFLDSVKVGLNTRRLEQDGRVGLAMKYVLAEMHLLFLGPIHHDRFKYKFDYDERVVKKMKEKMKNWQKE